MKAGFTAILLFYGTTKRKDTDCQQNSQIRYKWALQSTGQKHKLIHLNVAEGEHVILKGLI